MTNRRWRGEIDVPLTPAGLEKAKALAQTSLKGLSLVHHDWLSRCRDTATAIGIPHYESSGPRPWRMGPAFEGHPITRQSINYAQWLATNPHECPSGGEPFSSWYSEWMEWLRRVDDEGDNVAVVTHNRNIQAAYSTVNGKFVPDLYNVDGPDFCSVHRYRYREIVPWDGRLTPGVYLIRHGETEWGT